MARYSEVCRPIYILLTSFHALCIVLRSVKDHPSSMKLGICSFVILLVVFSCNKYHAFAQGNSSPFLYFGDSRREDIFRMSISGGSHESLNISSKMRISNPIAIAHDPIRKYIYWTERAKLISILGLFDGPKGIGRLSLTNGSVNFITLPTNSIPDGLAVDPISNLLYLTDTGNDVIQVIDFDARTKKTIVDLNLLEPRAIVIDPESGWMYWTDWGSSPRIEKARMDGTGRQSLVTTGLVWPNGIALDRQNDRLYFCEGFANSSSVQSVSINGSDRLMHYRDLLGFYQFFGIAVDSQNIYLTSWKHRSILQLPKNTIWRFSGSITFLPSVGELVSSKVRLTGIVLTGSSDQAIGNACSVNNGGCDHYCLPVNGGRTCASPDVSCNANQNCLEPNVLTTSTSTPDPTTTTSASTLTSTTSSSTMTAGRNFVPITSTSTPDPTTTTSASTSTSTTSSSTMTAGRNFVQNKDVTKALSGVFNDNQASMTTTSIAERRSAIGTTDGPNPIISKYMLLTLIPVPIVAILLLACCLKRKKCTKTQKDVEAEDNEGYYDDIDEMNMDHISNNQAVQSQNTEDGYESPVKRTNNGTPISPYATYQAVQSQNTEDGYESPVKRTNNGTFISPYTTDQAVQSQNIEDGYESPVKRTNNGTPISPYAILH